MGMSSEDTSGSLHLVPQFGRDTMGRTILEDGVQRMIPRIQRTHMETPCTPAKNGLNNQTNPPLQMELLSLVPPPSRCTLTIQEHENPKTQLKPRRQITKSQTGREGVRVDKWILDLRVLKKTSGQYFKQIIQNLNAPELWVDTDRFTVRRNSLLGQLLHVLTPAELNGYGNLN